MDSLGREQKVTKRRKDDPFNAPLDTCRFCTTKLLHMTLLAFLIYLHTPETHCHSCVYMICTLPSTVVPSKTQATPIVLASAPWSSEPPPSPPCVSGWADEDDGDDIAPPSGCGVTPSPTPPAPAAASLSSSSLARDSLPPPSPSPTSSSSPFASTGTGISSSRCPSSKGPAPSAIAAVAKEGCSNGSDTGPSNTMDSTAADGGAVAAASSGSSIKSCAVPSAVADARLATRGGRRRPKKKGDRDTSMEAPRPLL